MKLKHFWIRKIHSLLGIFPLGLFLLFYLALSLSLSQGRESFLQYHTFFLSLPYREGIILIFFWIPLASHGTLGLYNSLSTGVKIPRNPGRLPYFLYFLHRISGMAILAFFLYLLVVFQITAPTYLAGREYSVWFLQKLQSQMSSIPARVLYSVGFFSLIFHFSHGLWTSFKSWGITESALSRRVWGIFCLFLAFLLSGVACRFLYLLSFGSF